jgi:putative membrane protein
LGHIPHVANAALICGIVVLVATLGPWTDALAERSLSWHMAQHLALMMVAAPLVALGAPLRRLLAVLPHDTAKRLTRFLGTPFARALASPALAWIAMAAALYFTHLSPLYESALENDAVHAFEHGLYFGVALLFWGPILAVPPAPHAIPVPARIFYVFLAMPMSAFLGFAIYASTHPLYPHYAQTLGAAAALADQQNAGEVMWLAGGAVLFVTLLALAAEWMRQESRLSHYASEGGAHFVIPSGGVLRTPSSSDRGDK